MVSSAVLVCSIFSMHVWSPSSQPILHTLTSLSVADIVFRVGPGSGCSVRVGTGAGAGVDFDMPEEAGVDVDVCRRAAAKAGPVSAVCCLVLFLPFPHCGALALCCCVQISIGVDGRMNSYINVLRLLQKLTKRSPLHTALLAKLKAPVILKRVLGYAKEPAMRLYALKVCKGLVKHCPLRWRAANMALVNEVMGAVRAGLADDWLAVANDKDKDERNAQQAQLQVRTPVRVCRVRASPHVAYVPLRRAASSARPSTLAT